MKVTSIILMFLSLMFFACSSNNKDVRLGMVQWIGYAPFYIAESDSRLPKKLRLIDYPANYDIMESIKVGKLDAALLTLDEILKLTKDGVKLKIVLVLDTSNGADAIVAEKEIKDIVSLKGKRVAYEPNSVQEYLLFRALEINNMSMNDIIPVLTKYDE